MSGGRDLGRSGTGEVGWKIAGTVALLVGAAVRVLASRGDLWLDEIGAFLHARTMGSALDVVTRIHLDNNHPLATLWAYLLGPGLSSLVYRAPAIVAGVASIVLAGAITQAQSPSKKRVDRVRPLAIGAILMAGSYLMVHYASEARGYAPAIAFGLGALLAALRSPDWRFGAGVPVYWLCMALALLAHPLAVHLLVGVGAWHAVEVASRTAAPLGERLARWVLWQAPPLAFLGLLWVVHLSRMEVAGGPQLDPAAVVGSAVADTLGLPALPWVGWIALAAIVAGGVASLVVRPPRVDGEARPMWVFYLVSALLSPALLFATTSDPLVYERYFAVCLAVVLLLLAATLDRIAALGRRGEVVVGLVLALAWLGSAVPTMRLVRFGRGRYREALADIAASSPGARITIGGDQDLRIAALIEYYADEATGPGRRMVYLPADQWTKDDPQWFIWGWESFDKAPPERFETTAGAAYAARAKYSYAQLSGFNWVVYERLPSGT